jgi:superfamily II DNA or RNA helicase
MNAFPILMAA